MILLTCPKTLKILYFMVGTLLVEIFCMHFNVQNHSSTINCKCLLSIFCKYFNAQ